MNKGVSTSASVALHIALLALLSAVSIEQVEKIPPPPGMELELIDVEHAMALPSPSVAAAETTPDAPPPSASPAPPAPPVAPVPPVAPARPAPAPVARPVEVAPQLAPAPVAPMPKPAPAAATVSPPTPAASVTAHAVPAQPVPAKPVPAKPAPAKPSLNGAALAQMLARRAGTGTQTRLNSAAIGSAIGRAAPKGAAGLSVRQRMNLEDMIRSQITPCWNPPVAQEGQSTVTVLARIRLGRDGGVQGDPAVATTKGENVAYARALAASVRRAVLRCAPLKLPAELYDAWSDVELKFDPRDIS